MVKKARVPVVVKSSTSVRDGKATKVLELDLPIAEVLVPVERSAKKNKKQFVKVPFQCKIVGYDDLFKPISFNESTSTIANSSAGTLSRGAGDSSRPVSRGSDSSSRGLQTPSSSSRTRPRTVVSSSQPSRSSSIESAASSPSNRSYKKSGPGLCKSRKNKSEKKRKKEEDRKRKKEEKRRRGKMKSSISSESDIPRYGRKRKSWIRKDRKRPERPKSAGSSREPSTTSVDGRPSSQSISSEPGSRGPGRERESFFRRGRKRPKRPKKAGSSREPSTESIDRRPSNRSISSDTDIPRYGRKRKSWIRKDRKRPERPKSAGRSREPSTTSVDGRPSSQSISSEPSSPGPGRERKTFFRRGRKRPKRPKSAGRSGDPSTDSMDGRPSSQSQGLICTKRNRCFPVSQDEMCPCQCPDCCCRPDGGAGAAGSGQVPRSASSPAYGPGRKSWFGKGRKRPKKPKSAGRSRDPSTDSMDGRPSSQGPAYGPGRKSWFGKGRKRPKKPKSAGRSRDPSTDSMDGRPSSQGPAYGPGRKSWFGKGRKRPKKPKSAGRSRDPSTDSMDGRPSSQGLVGSASGRPYRDSLDLVRPKSKPSQDYDPKQGAARKKREPSPSIFERYKRCMKNNLFAGTRTKTGKSAENTCTYEEDLEPPVVSQDGRPVPRGRCFMNRCRENRIFPKRAGARDKEEKKRLKDEARKSRASIKDAKKAQKRAAKEARRQSRDAKKAERARQKENERRRQEEKRRRRKSPPSDSYATPVSKTPSRISSQSGSPDSGSESCFGTGRKRPKSPKSAGRSREPSTTSMDERPSSEDGRSRRPDGSPSSPSTSRQSGSPDSGSASCLGTGRKRPKSPKSAGRSREPSTTSMDERPSSEDERSRRPDGGPRSAYGGPSSPRSSTYEGWNSNYGKGRLFDDTPSQEYLEPSESKAASGDEGTRSRPIGEGGQKKPAKKSILERLGLKRSGGAKKPKKGKKSKSRASTPVKPSKSNISWRKGGATPRRPSLTDRLSDRLSSPKDSRASLASIDSEGSSRAGGSRGGGSRGSRRSKESRGSLAPDESRGSIATSPSKKSLSSADKALVEAIAAKPGLLSSLRNMLCGSTCCTQSSKPEDMCQEINGTFRIIGDVESGRIDLFVDNATKKKLKQALQELTRRTEQYAHTKQGIKNSKFK